MISALSLTSLPKQGVYLPFPEDGDTIDPDQLREYLANGSEYEFDLERVLRDQYYPSAVFELSELVSRYGIADVPILFCRLSTGFMGYASTDEHVPGPLIQIDPSQVSDAEGLQALYLHELAHLYTTNSDGHDMQFVISLNYLRALCEMPPSTDPYDYCDCFAHDGIEPDRAVELSTVLSTKALAGSWPVDVVVSSVAMARYSGVAWNEIPSTLCIEVRR